MSNKSFEYSYIDELVSETDDIRKESLLNKLKCHLSEMEQSCKFIDDLRSKFTILQEEFNRLANEKKKIEIDLNRKISQLTKQVMIDQSANEQLHLKYKSAKQKAKSIESAHIKEIEDYRIENSKLKKSNEGLTCDIQDLIKENDSLINELDNMHLQTRKQSQIRERERENEQEGVINLLEKQLQEANESISKMITYIKELEHKNEKLIEQIDNSNSYNITSANPNSNNKDVIIGLKRVITEKEKTISTLYNNFDKLNIKNDELLEQIASLKMQLKHNNNFSHTNIDIIDNENSGSNENDNENNIDAFSEEDNINNQYSN